MSLHKQNKRARWRSFVGVASPYIPPGNWNQPYPESSVFYNCSPYSGRQGRCICALVKTVGDDASVVGGLDLRRGTREINEIQPIRKRELVGTHTCAAGKSTQRQISCIVFLLHASFDLSLRCHGMCMQGISILEIDKS